MALAAFYDWVHAEQGFSLPPHMLPVCYALTDTRIRNLAVIVGPGSSKSTLLSIVYPTWMIGHSPANTVLNISAGESLPQGFLLSCARVIENSDAFKLTFPKVTPDKGAGWSTERGLFVTGHPPSVPDANYLGVGLGSSALTGKHAKIILCDDIHDRENASTAEACQKVRDAYSTTILGRADPSGARFIVAGRRWSLDDIYGELLTNEAYVVMTLPFEREGSSHLYWDIAVPDGMACVFTDRKIRCADGEWVSV